MMEYIFGSAALVIFYFILVQAIESFFVTKKKQELTSQILDMKRERERREVVKQIQEVDNKIIDKTKAYEAKKAELYELIKKRNSNNPD